MQPEDNKVHEIWNASHHAPDDTLSNQQNIFLNSDWVKAKPSWAQPRPDLLLTLVTTFYLRHFIRAEKASSLCNTRILRCLDSGGFLQFVSSQIFLVHFIANDISILKNQTMYFRLSVQVSIFPSAPAKCHVRSQAGCLSQSFPEWQIMTSRHHLPL